MFVEEFIIHSLSAPHKCGRPELKEKYANVIHGPAECNQEVVQYCDDGVWSNLLTMDRCIVGTVTLTNVRLVAWRFIRPRMCQIRFMTSIIDLHIQYIKLVAHVLFNRWSLSFGLRHMWYLLMYQLACLPTNHISPPTYLPLVHGCHALGPN